MADLVLDNMPDELLKWISESAKRLNLTPEEYVRQFIVELAKEYNTPDPNAYLE